MKDLQQTQAREMFMLDNIRSLTETNNRKYSKSVVKQ